MATSGSYRIYLSDGAILQLNALDRSVRERIHKKLAQLAILPPARTLHGYSDRWVLEIGDYRALYSIDEKNRTKIVAFIGAHKEYQRRYDKMFGKK